MGKTYDPNVDYMKKMQEAAQVGDLEQAAFYEQKRNEKIKGEGLSQYAQTHSYEKYLPKTTAKQMEEIFDKIQKREPFSYDLQADKLYTQYRDQYSKQGKLAMEDARGQAAALTGGYGNSYAQTLGQQAYDRELDKLNAVIPELYEKAKEDYDTQGTELYAQFDRLAKQYAAEQELELEQEQRDYERAQAKEKLEYDRAQAQKEAEYAKQKKEQDRAYSLALKMLTAGLMPSKEVLSSSGLSSADANKLYEANLPKTQTGGGSSSSSSGKGTSSKGSGSKTEATGGGKALSSSLWEKLRSAYRKGEGSKDLGEFLQYRSTLEAQGYDVAAFDSWARSTYGKSYTSGAAKTVDQQSILALGYGPISMERLAQLVAQGKVEQFTEGDYIYYRRIPRNLQTTKAPKGPVLPGL